MTSGNSLVTARAEKAGLGLVVATQGLQVLQGLLCNSLSARHAQACNAAVCLGLMRCWATINFAFDIRVDICS